jgi:CubicO group peptidase (beta-lactamase class C family)
MLQPLLDELAAAHGIPGAAAAVLRDGSVEEAATGVLNLSTGVAATTDSLFQIGSVTKVWTATLVLQLVEEGLVDLDVPVRTYLPELELADAAAAEAVTLRQLLSHTGGLGDDQRDTGRGNDCLERYVESCRTLAQTAPPGRVLSYSNPGFRIAGRVVERVTGVTWNDALRERLLAPLGLERTVTLPEEAILHRAAVGHLVDPESGRLRRTDVWHWPRSSGPSGGIVSTAAELLAFARLHLDGDDTLRSMQTRVVTSPNPWFTSGWGLGWALYDWGGPQVIGHDGGGVGQAAFLRVVPELRFAVSLVVNSSTAAPLYRDLFTQLFADAGIDVPAPPEASTDVRVDPRRFVGTYATGSVRLEVVERDGGLGAHVDYGGYMLATPSGSGVPLRAIDETSFLAAWPSPSDALPIVFFDDDRFVHWGGRAYPRCA